MNICLTTTYSFHQLGGRPNQEDARYPDSDTIDSAQRFFVVCDGVGGSQKGEVASATVCASFAASLSKVNLDEVDFDKAALSKVVDAAYDALDKAARKVKGDMGTTMTFVCFHTGGCMMAHIGDSRIYQIRPTEGMIYRSEDHSLVSSMVRNGAITPEQAIDHPQSNVITRCMEPTREGETRGMVTVANTKDVKAGDYFLLCTDCVLHSITDEDLVAIISSDKTNEEKRNILAKKSETSADNNTAILIKVESVTDDNLVEDGQRNTLKFPRDRYTSSELASEQARGFVKSIKNLWSNLF